MRQLYRGYIGLFEAENRRIAIFGIWILEFGFKDERLTPELQTIQTLPTPPIQPFSIMTPKLRILIAFAVLSLLIGMARAVQRPESTGSASGAFSAMTFNVGDAHRDRFPVAETAACILSDGRPGVLFLQEMPGGDAGRELATALDYPYAVRTTAAAGKMAGLMVFSQFPIVETREIGLPSRGKGAGALCAVLDMDGERVLACSVHLDEVEPKKRDAQDRVVISIGQAVDLLYAEFFTDTVRTQAAKVLGRSGETRRHAGDFGRRFQHGVRFAHHPLFDRGLPGRRLARRGLVLRHLPQGGVSAVAAHRLHLRLRRAGHRQCPGLVPQRRGPLSGDGARPAEILKTETATD